MHPLTYQREFAESILSTYRLHLDTTRTTWSDGERVLFDKVSAEPGETALGQLNRAIARADEALADALHLLYS